MKLHQLKRASEFEIKEWLLSDIVELTPYQREKIRDAEMFRLSPFYFYKIEKQKSSFLWRITLPFFIVYYLLAVISLPFNFLITGKWGYGRDFYDKFHSPWVRKLGI